ncbi:MAG: hypothetical protein ACREQA_17075 [Candidatus Binatia bacterium]
MNERTIGDLVERLNRLEKQNRWLKIVAALLLIATIALWMRLPFGP